MKKILSAILCTAMLAAICLFATGCKLEPYKVTRWYLDSFIDEDGFLHKAGYNPAEQSYLFSDDVRLEYHKRNTFILNLFDKELQGTYTYKISKATSYTTLTFSDGTTASGTNHSPILGDESATLSYKGVIYYFCTSNDESRFDFSRETYSEFAEPIYKALQNGSIQIDSLRFSTTLTKGEITITDGNYIFTAKNGTSENLSAGRRTFTYETVTFGKISRGDNTLREGLCFMNKTTYEKPETEDDVVYTDYAVWYYADNFAEACPWAADIRKDDIISVDADYVGMRTEGYSLTEKWNNNNPKINLLVTALNSSLAYYKLPENKVYEEEKTTYTIKNATDSYALTIAYVRYGDYWLETILKDGEYYMITRKTTESSMKRQFPEIGGDYFYKIDGGSAKVYINDETGSSSRYNVTVGDLVFIKDKEYTGSAESFVTLIKDDISLGIIDEKTFVWSRPYYGTAVYRLIGDYDFSEILALA